MASEIKTEVKALLLSAFVTLAGVMFTAGTRASNQDSLLSTLNRLETKLDLLDSRLQSNNVETNKNAAALKRIESSVDKVTPLVYQHQAIIQKLVKN
ncbi:hypothetical protein [Photobacterium damselae]|uniref:hypothetical protein n=1 Tax=Photobacterium damselae TaxID=38293 RepID=UPI001F2FE70B|nr:hypothetical protein [Photobacterium damselae]UKA12936.1 hypothetical protein IHC91_21360 [Photobacterium damselae subsp. damselae]